MSPRRRPGRDDIQAGTHALNEIEELHPSWTPAFVGAAINSALPQADKAGTKQVCCRRIWSRWVALEQAHAARTCRSLHDFLDKVKLSYNLSR